MAASKVVLTISKIWLSEVPLSPDQEMNDRPLRCCVLKWRQGKLWVKASEISQPSDLPALQNQQWLQNCLKHSPIDLVCLDPQLGVASLEYWANACEQAGKLVFLRLPGRSQQIHQSKTTEWIGQQLDSALAVLLLLLFSPVFIGLFLLLRLTSADPVFCYEWRVGARGRLFQLITFAAAQAHQPNGSFSSLIRRWVTNLRLTGFPQLINVAQGKMRLIGRRPWNLQEAIHLPSQRPQPIGEQPGVIQDLFARMG
jgi:hypothetical protein